MMRSFHFNRVVDTHRTKPSERACWLGSRPNSKKNSPFSTPTPPSLLGKYGVNPALSELGDSRYAPPKNQNYDGKN
jgi:hypothetical protein